MHYYEVAPNQIFRATSMSFTYSSDTPLSIGQIVSIEVGKKSCLGVIIRETKKPHFSTKPTLANIETPLPEGLIKTALWMSNYYHTHLATVLQTILPRGIQKKRRERLVTPQHPSFRDRTKIVLNKNQSEALTAIRAMSPGTALLHGITGSGKTQIYIELTQDAISRGKSVILLVPEIALTSQLIDEFSRHFNDIILTHSKQTEAERHLSWQDALTSSKPRIIIGPRSALFLPLASIGVIIIDEAHEPSFKQEQSPRYSAQRTASILATHHGAKLILGSATPPISDYHLALQAQRPIIEMTTLAKAGAKPPTVSIVDMTKRDNFKHHRFISNTLFTQMTQTLADGNQVLLFHNRRGSTTITLCESCGWSAQCPKCFIPTTLHADKHQLLCHTCGFTQNVPTSCPVCNSTHILHKGIGTKLIESEVAKLFPDKVIARFDGDSTIAQGVDQRYKELYNGDIDIIIGTQVVAKGLDLPKLRTVGIIQADAGLSLPDFSTSERTFQLIAQVVGRVGRNHHSTHVVIQSYQPTHPAILDGASQNYHHFYQIGLQERKKGLFPPFTHLLKLTCIYKTEASAIKNTQQFALHLKKTLPADVTVLGPTPAFYERQHDTYRWQIILKSPVRAHLLRALSELPPTHWQAELDPLSLLS